MAAALPFIGTGLGILSAVEGAGAAGKQNQINEEQLRLAAYQQHLGRLLGEEGAAGNPFGKMYASAFASSPDPLAGKPAARALPKYFLGHPTGA